MSMDDVTPPPDRRDPAVRRRQILADALRAADRRRHAGIARRTGAVALVAVCAAGVAFVTVTGTNPFATSPEVAVVQPATRPGPPTRPSAVEHEVTPPGRDQRAAPTRPAPTGVIVQVIRDEPGARSWQTLSDDELLAELAAAGQPAGIVRLNGRTVLVPANMR